MKAEKKLKGTPAQIAKNREIAAKRKGVPLSPELAAKARENGKLGGAPVGMSDRPTVYDPEIVERIFRLMAKGKSLLWICDTSKDKTFPGTWTFFKWLDDPANEWMRANYVRARQLQAEHFAQEILQISDDGRNDTYIDEETGRVVTDHDVVTRSRLRVDTRKWIASKLLPKVYGDRITTEVTGADGGPIQIQAQVQSVVKNLSTEELKALANAHSKLKLVSN